MLLLPPSPLPPPTSPHFFFTSALLCRHLSSLYSPLPFCSFFTSFSSSSYLSHFPSPSLLHLLLHLFSSCFPSSFLLFLPPPLSRVLISLPPALFLLRTSFSSSPDPGLTQQQEFSCREEEELLVVEVGKVKGAAAGAERLMGAFGTQRGGVPAGASGS